MKLPILGILLLAAAGLSSHAAPATLPVVPAVLQWTPAAGTLDCPGFSVVTGDFADVAALLRDDAKLIGRTAAGPAVRFVKGSVDALPAGSRADEAYRLEIGARDIGIRAATPAGAYWATRTLLQLAAPTNVLPRGVVVDAPRYARRMLMLDVGRKPTPLPVLYDYLRLMAWHKMNELHLHLSDEAFGGGYTGMRVQCDTFPGLASRDLHYTKAELRALQDFAKQRGIVITPEIDMPGHARAFTDYWPGLLIPGESSKSYLDVTNPKTIERMKALLDELIPVFDAPDFHIGTDEYRIGGSPARKAELHEAFRQFINTMNTHIRSKGKNTRIWSGFEHMQGTTDIDGTVIIDMWETDDAQGQIARGHAVINSNHGRTYIVPGAHYYGVSNPGIYNSWEPWMVSGDAAKNPAPDDPKLLGGKLHVWNDQGPTGYTQTEIAWLTRPSLQAFAEKLWGTKGSPDYAAFQARAAGVERAPGVALFDRRPAQPDGTVLAQAREIALGGADARVEFDGKADRADLEWPWTLTVEVKRTADFDHRGVILGSDLAELCANFAREEERKEKGADGREVKTKFTRRGLGLVRSAGAPGPNPSVSHLSKDVSRVYADPLPLNQWVSLAVVGTERRTQVYVNGELKGESGEQMVCPLARLGAADGSSFAGSVRNLRVVDRALTAKEIGRAAGLDIPDNLAEGARVTASASDDAHGFTAGLAADGKPDTRWSSAPTAAEQWLQLDLGAPKTFNAVTVKWEVACPKAYRVEASEDGQAWRALGEGEGREGLTELRVPETTARQVRLIMTKPATGWGYSVWEVEVLKRRGAKP